MSLMIIKHSNNLGTINLIALLEGKFTYTTRNGYAHLIHTQVYNKTSILVYYYVAGKIKRKISRIFPKKIRVSARLIWLIGFVCGEGLKSKNSRSSMYRFSVTNNDPLNINRTIEILDETNLLKKKDLPNKCVRINYGFNCNKTSLRHYWSKELDLTLEKIEIASKPQIAKRAEYGTASLYISDVLLRRVIDIILEAIIQEIFGLNLYSKDFKRPN